METNKNGTDNKSEQEQVKKNSSNPFDGFDFSKLMQNEGVMELLKHLISGGGAMAANYFLWIKPMQDKIETLSKKIEENEKEIKKQDERIEELEDEQEDLFTQLKSKGNKEEELQAGKGEFFSLRKNISLPEYRRK